MLSDEQRWQIESDVKTLKDAELIKADKGRFKLAMEKMDEEMAAMQSVKMADADKDAKRRFPNTFKED